MVLLFHPTTQEEEHSKNRKSSVLVFQLRTPNPNHPSPNNPHNPTTTRSMDRRNIPLPSYLMNTTTNTNNQEDNYDHKSSSSRTGSRSKSRSNRRDRAASTLSPVVATNPKFVIVMDPGGTNSSTTGMGMCMDAPSNATTTGDATAFITAICCIGNSNNNNTTPSSCGSGGCFLAIQNDQTLLWINIRTGQIMRTASLTAVVSSSLSAASFLTTASTPKVATESSRNTSIIDTMITSPLSSYEKGKVLVVLRTNTNTSSYSNSNNNNKSGIAVYEWNLVNVIKTTTVSSSTTTTKITTITKAAVEAIRPKWMQVQLLSFWTTPGSEGRNSNSDNSTNSNNYNNNNTNTVVADICFGSLPSIVCVVYHYSASVLGIRQQPPTTTGTNHNYRQRIAQVLCLNDTTGELQPIDASSSSSSLCLSFEQIEQVSDVSASLISEEEGKMGENSQRISIHDDTDTDTDTDTDNESDSSSTTSVTTIYDTNTNTNTNNTSSNIISNDDSNNNNNHDNTILPFQYVRRLLYGIEHDSESDSFVISSMFGSGFGIDGGSSTWIGCVWNWRSNSIGWMIRKQITKPMLMTMMTNFSLSSSSPQPQMQQLSTRVYCGRNSCQGGGSYFIYINSLLRYNHGRSSSSSADNNNSLDDADDAAAAVAAKKNRMLFIETNKRIVPLAVLTPGNASNPGVFTERCSLLLGNDHVSFPCISEKLNDPTRILELDWTVAAFPSSYVSSYGTPKIATIGPANGKYIAISSVSGVCVLDTRQNQHYNDDDNGNDYDRYHQFQRHRQDNYYYKWKQFGTPIEERSFSVVAMTWWEGNTKGRNNHGSDDLLIAIIQTRNDEQYLSCWSPKRLDLMHQLMDTPDLEWKPGESQDPEPSWGIPLAKDTRMKNLHLLAEPPQQGKSTGDCINGKKCLRRAVVLLYSTNGASTVCDYQLFRLQVFRNKLSKVSSDEPYAARRPYYVMTYKVLQATIPNNDDDDSSDNNNSNDGRWLGPVSSVFIAGAWFQFDLTKLGIKGKKEESEDFAVTLGLTRTPGGMQAISVTKNLVSRVATITKTEVSRYQVSDIVPTTTNTTNWNISEANEIPVFRFVWSIELLNGDILCWSVPSVISINENLADVTRNVLLAPSEITPLKNYSLQRQKGLCRPYLLFNKRNTRGDNNQRWIHGKLCEVGNVSFDWALQSSSGCQFDIALGQVPQSHYGCVLKAGQSCQHFTRAQIGDINSRMFSSNILEIDTYSQSPFMMSPPAFVISLYTLFLEAASIDLDLLHSKNSPLVAITRQKSRLKLIESQMQNRLTSSGKTDASTMALRLILFRSLELIAQCHEKQSKDPCENSNTDLLLSQKLLSTIVTATRRSTSNLQFATLFLEIGRQIEPSNLAYLFPLLPVDNSSEDGRSIKPSNMDNVFGKMKARTVVDLLMICLTEGSLAASASALPLLTSTAEARHYCCLLLDKAIHNYTNNTSSDKCNFDRTEEERRGIGDFFRFGMKLEDAELCEASKGKSLSYESTSVDTLDQTIDSNSIDDETITPEVKRNLICNFTTSSAILNYIVPSSLLGRAEKQKQKTEDAIKQEASSFIQQSMNDPSPHFTVLPDWEGSSDGSYPTSNSDISSVGGLVGDSLLDLLHPLQTDNNWKAMTGIAKMILTEGVEIPSSYHLFREVAEKAQPLDVLSLVPDTFDFNNSHEENMITYIKEEVATCSSQVSSDDANCIVDLALLLIDRILLISLTDITDQTAMETGLVVIILVAGHVGGRSQLIQNTMDDYCVINKCYKKATNRKS